MATKVLATDGVTVLNKKRDVKRGMDVVVVVVAGEGEGENIF